MSTKRVGEWQKVIPDGVWPLKYFGKFECQPKEKMRDWERRLNNDVRKQLKEEIELEFKRQQFKEPHKINIMITRVCLYVPLGEDMDVEPMDTSN